MESPIIGEGEALDVGAGGVEELRVVELHPVERASAPRLHAVQQPTRRQVPHCGHHTCR